MPKGDVLYQLGSVRISGNRCDAIVRVGTVPDSGDADETTYRTKRITVTLDDAAYESIEQIIVGSLLQGDLQGAQPAPERAIPTEPARPIAVGPTDTALAAELGAKNQ